jgi:hypothetical protein
MDNDAKLGIISKGNTFDRPLDEKRKEFDERLAAVLRKRAEN